MKTKIKDLEIQFESSDELLDFLSKYQKTSETKVAPAQEVQKTVYVTRRRQSFSHTERWQMCYEFMLKKKCSFSTAYKKLTKQHSVGGKNYSEYKIWLKENHPEFDYNSYAGKRYITRGYTKRDHSTPRKPNAFLEYRNKAIKSVMKNNNMNYFDALRYLAVQWKSGNRVFETEKPVEFPVILENPDLNNLLKDMFRRIIDGKGQVKLSYNMEGVIFEINGIDAWHDFLSKIMSNSHLIAKYFKVPNKFVLDKYTLMYGA